MTASAENMINLRWLLPSEVWIEYINHPVDTFRKKQRYYVDPRSKVELMQENFFYHVAKLMKNEIPQGTFDERTEWLSKNSLVQPYMMVSRLTKNGNDMEQVNRWMSKDFATQKDWGILNWFVYRYFRHINTEDTYSELTSRVFNICELSEVLLSSKFPNLLLESDEDEVEDSLLDNEDINPWGNYISEDMLEEQVVTEDIASLTSLSESEIFDNFISLAEDNGSAWSRDEFRQNGRAENTE